MCSSSDIKSIEGTVLTALYSLYLGLYITMVLLISSALSGTERMLRIQVHAHRFINIFAVMDCTV